MGEEVPFDLVIPRGRLLLINPTEYDSWEEWVRDNYLISKKGDRILKDQRRLVTNRHYSNQSRTRKRQELESTKRENETLRQRIGLLEEENRVLKERLERVPLAEFDFI